MELKAGNRYIGRADKAAVVIHPARSRFGANTARLNPVWYVELSRTGAWHYFPWKARQATVEKFVGSHGLALDDLAWETRSASVAKIPPWELKSEHELVYFIEAVGSNRIKIGITDSLHSRLTLVKTYSPFPVVVIGCIYGYREMEEEIHHKFKYLRKHGEWFDDAPELRNYINHMTGGEVLPMLNAALKGGDAVPMVK